MSTWADDPEGEDTDVPTAVLEASNLLCDVYEAMCAADVEFTDDEVALVAARLWRRGYVLPDTEGAPAWHALG